MTVLGCGLYRVCHYYLIGLDDSWEDLHRRISIVSPYALYRVLGHCEGTEPLPGSPHTTMDVFFSKVL